MGFVGKEYFCFISVKRDLVSVKRDLVSKASISWASWVRSTFVLVVFVFHLGMGNGFNQYLLYLGLRE